MSNVIPLRPLIQPAPKLPPPDPAEITAARCYDLFPDFTVEAFVRVCGDQIRCGRALDEWLRIRARQERWTRK